MIEIKTWEELDQCDNVDLKTYLKNLAKDYENVDLVELVGDSVFIVEDFGDLKRLKTPEGSLYDTPFPMDSIISFVDKYSFFYSAHHNGGGWLAVIPVELIRNFASLRTTVKLTYA